MARDTDDVTEGASDREGVSAATARRRALPDSSLSSDAMADAIAKAHFRVRDQEAREKEKPLPDTIRASVRCGYETTTREMNGQRTLVTAPKSLTFRADETADGTTVTVPHGKPVRLKREAFLRYKSAGEVEFG